LHQIAEGAAAAALAALLKERAQMANRNVGLILSGGNIERAWLAQVLNGHTPAAA
jgi:threonine dehydratase